MKLIYQREIEVAVALESDSERMNYLGSVLRSMMQALAIVSLEAVRELTPYSAHEANLGQLILRFAQPSEGLYREILEETIPIVRSHIAKTFMLGWFEKTDRSAEPFAAAITAWVQFRNRKPAHGVVSRQDSQIWTPRLLELTERCLDQFSNAMPLIEGMKLTVQIGDSLLPLSTPLVCNGKALVIGEVGARKGIWKMKGQILNIDVAEDVTLDLAVNPIFDVSAESGATRFEHREFQIGDSKVSFFHNIPARQTNTFEGRTKELDTLVEWISDEDSRFCLVYGDGGFGKTTLALEFLNRLIEGDIAFKGKPPSIISYYTAKMTRWTSEGLVHFKGVSDAMEDSIRELLFCMYPILGKEWYKVSGTALVDKVAGELEQQGFRRDDVILVLDNTETLANSPAEVDDLSEFLKRAGKKIGRIIITSRRREFLPATPIKVSGLTDEEAMRLMRRLAHEYAAIAINQAGDPKLRQVCVQLTNKPLLIDTLVKYIARSGTGIEAALEQVLKKTSDQLLEFLYEDAWMRMNDLHRKVFLILVSLANPIDGRCIGDTCQEVGLQHVEFQSGLDETYFATVIDRRTTYDLEIVDLAKQFFRKKVQKLDLTDQDEIKSLATKVDRQAVRREELDRAYVYDRVADAFRSQYAKAAKIAVDRGDFVTADQSFKLAILEEPMNAALKDRYAWFLFRLMHGPKEAMPFAEEAVRLDPKSGDARITLGLIYYQLGNIELGDKSIDQAMVNGKSKMLCYLRMGIARYHLAKSTPYSRVATNLIKEAEMLLREAERSADFDDYYYYKNLHDVRRYNSLVATLKAGINRREVQSKDAPDGASAIRS